jgi:hypothetical protein
MELVHHEANKRVMMIVVHLIDIFSLSVEFFF